MVFDSVSSNIDEVLPVNPSANVFLFGDFNVHYVINFSISNDLTRRLNFPYQIPDCDHHSSAFLDIFLSSDTSICSQWLSLNWEIRVMLSQFPLTFQ